MLVSVLIFLASATAVVLASSQMAKYSDVIAIKTGLGRLFIGTVLLAGATSLPELLTNIISVQRNLPDLAAGNLMGSCIFNMFLIAVLDMTHSNARVLRRIASTHTLTASLGIVLLGLSALFILARLNWGIGWVGLDSLLLVVIFVAGLYLIRSQGVAAEEGDSETGMSLRRAILLFALMAGILWLAAPYLVQSSSDLANALGVGAGFFGASALAIVTSIPEIISSLAAVRMGAYDLAVGNLFGSNVFNVMTLGVVDVFYTKGFFLSSIDSSFAIAGLIALLLTALALIGNLVRLERRILFIEVDALLIVIGYALGMALLYAKGVSLG